PVDRWIYYCVDDFTVWPGLDGELMKRLERDLARRAHRVVAASPILQERVESLGVRAPLLPHGGHPPHRRHPSSHRNRRADAGADPAAWAAGLPRPMLLFWGLIDRRLDLAWVAAAARVAASVVLVGPQQDPDPSIGAIPKIHVPGPVPYAALPALARHADALI